MFRVILYDESNHTYEHLFSGVSEKIAINEAIKETDIRDIHTAKVVREDLTIAYYEVSTVISAESLLPFDKDNPSLTPLPEEDQKIVPGVTVKKKHTTVYVYPDDSGPPAKWPSSVEEATVLKIKDVVRDFTKEAPQSWCLGKATYRKALLQIGEAQAWADSRSLEVVS